MRVEASAITPRVERANGPSFSGLTAWSIVCALQKYIRSYADFRRLQGGVLVLSRKKGDESA